MMRTHVTLPRLVTEGHIDILVDTGAQVTCILGADAGILNVPYESLSQPATLRGVGGTTVMYREPAILTFRDTENGRIYRYRTEVRIGPHTRPANNLPSLLGQEYSSTGVCSTNQRREDSKPHRLPDDVRPKL